jgi:hypothetical protein
MKSKKYNSFLPGLGGAVTGGVTSGATAGAQDAVGKLVNSLIGPIANLFTGLFGGGFATSTGVRWLGAWYQHYMLGQESASPTKNMTDDIAKQAQAVFTAITGVPIYDRYRMAALQGVDAANGNPLNIPDTQKVDNYLALGPDTQNVDPAIVMKAVQIAKKFVHHTGAGSWKQFAVPAQVMDKSVSQYLPNAGGSGTGTGTGTGSAFLPGTITSPGSIPKWIWYAGGALIAVILIVVIVKAAKK